MKKGRVALVVAAFLLPAWLQAQEPVTAKRTRPPRELKRVPYPEPHYTPYEPPEVLSPDLKVHIVVKGDTLWDLALTYLGDNYYWPQIWEANRYVTDPRWIYPGDPLVIPVPMAIAEVPPPPPEGDLGLDLSLLPAPEPAAKHVDVYCASYILREGGGGDLEPSHEEVASSAGTWDNWNEQAARQASADPEGLDPVDPNRLGAPRIIESEYGYDRVSVAEGDVVYINRGARDGVQPGDEFFVLAPARDVYHPVTLQYFGIAMALNGRIKVLCTQDTTATAEVVDSCTALEEGDMIKPFEPIPIPLVSEISATPAHCNELDAPVEGTIIYARGDKQALGQEDVVNIDLGADQGLAPGDFLTIIRSHPTGGNLPRKVVGDAVVLMVERDTATTKIVSSRDMIVRGDKVALR